MMEELLSVAIGYHQAGDLQQAEQVYRQILQAAPDYAEAHNRLGIALAQQGKLDEAGCCFQRALELKPEFVGACNNLGILRLQQRKADEAVAWCQRALWLKPDFADAHNTLGNAWKEQERMEDAVACYHRAIQLKPDYAVPHYNLGLVRKDQGRLDEALVWFDKALELAPDYAEPHLNRAEIWLLRGDFERGWPEYEWRWKVKECRRRPQFSQPFWEGRPLGGETILLYDEQGMGDTIQFIRYADLVKRRGARVVVECHGCLVPLLARSAGIDELVPRGGILPRFDVHCPLMSLARVFKTTLETIPRNVPYLFADPALVDRWQERLSRHPGFRVGIVWQGRPTFPGDRYRSIPLVQFAPLAEVPEASLISLQKGFGSEQLAALEGRFPISEAGEFDEHSGTDRAAILANLDLLITSDTAMAHLAGAMGVPVWVALPYVPDWRWLLGREDSPWYPTMRLFRQTSLGDWQGVFQRMKEALVERVQVSPQCQVKHEG